MKRVIILFLLIISIPITLQAQSPHQPKRLLLELNVTAAEFIETLDRDYPRVTILETFKTLFDGIAIEGQMHQLDRIVEDEAVKQAYPITTYSVTPEKVQFIEQGKIPSRPKNADQHTYTGKGVKIGVIDTGIDYTHPDLEANYQGGYDLVDFDDDPMETTLTQGIPTIHGTHVAGIIAANGTVQGVAPDAELYGYRALGPGGFGTSVQVIAAIEKAVNDGMDIINLSLGNRVNGPDYPTSLAVNQAIKHGVSVVIANGNSGPNEWTVGSPATATDAISVGASTQKYQTPILIEPKQNKQIQIKQISNTKDWTLNRDYSVEYHGLGIDALPDLTGKIVLFKRGEISFLEKITNAIQANAEAVIIFNNSPDPIEAGVEGSEILDIPAVFISEDDGEWLTEQIETSSQLWLRTKYETRENHIANFSSRGPVTANWEIKPDIVAPGVDIISTIPNGYASLQGTSMAAPYVTGALAVLKEAHLHWTPAQLKAALLTQANRINDQTPTEQGMGEVNLSKSIHTSVLITNSMINFGLIDERVNRQTEHVTITNVSDAPIKVRFSRPPIKKGVRWTLPKSTTLHPNEAKTLPIQLSIRPDQLKTGIYQDYLTVEIDRKDYHLPYLFINQTAEFPHIAGFEVEQSYKDEQIYHIRLQLANTTESLMIELYDPVTYAYLGELLYAENLEAGLFETTIDLSDEKQLDQYLLNVTITTDNETTYYQHTIH